MMNIARLTFNPFLENTYVVYDETGECIVIDAGNYSATEDRKLADFIAEKKLRPVTAVNTHGHVDHLLGVPFVTDTWEVPFALRNDDKFLVETAVEHGKIYGFQVKSTPSVGIDLAESAQIKFGATTLEVIHTPGHTPGHVCFYEPTQKILFSGDTLFRESIGRTDLPGGDYSWIMKSILEKIMSLGGDVEVYPGHGEKTTIGHELLYNPFITEVIQGEVNYK